MTLIKIKKDFMEHGTDDTRDLLLLLHSSFYLLPFFCHCEKFRGDMISLDTIRVTWEAFFMFFFILQGPMLRPIYADRYPHYCDIIIQFFSILPFLAAWILLSA